MAKISLMKCKRGDVLISVHGKAFIYDEHLRGLSYPHIIKDALTGNVCSRLTNGQVYKVNRLKSDHDIIKIIHINK